MRWHSVEEEKTKAVIFFDREDISTLGSVVVMLHAVATELVCWSGQVGPANVGGDCRIVYVSLAFLYRSPILPVHPKS